MFFKKKNSLILGIKKLNSPVTSEEIESVINLPSNKIPGLDGMNGEFFQIQKTINTYLSQTLPKH